MQPQADVFTAQVGALRALAAELGGGEDLRVGYRERMQIERPLFLVLKEIIRRELQFELRGLSDEHRRLLDVQLSAKRCPKEIQALVRDVFELRVFLVAMSSADPYLGDEALAPVLATSSGVGPVMARRLYSIVQLAEDLWFKC